MDDFLLEKIEVAYKNRDLEALKKIAIPKKRVLNRDRKFRSVLMLSCHKIKHLSKIASLDAESIMLNLEDGVSKEEKPFALVLCAIFLAHYTKIDKKLVVRVNALDESGLEEIAYLNKFMPDAIRVPKINTPEDVNSVLKILDKDIELHLSIETSKSWSNLSLLALDKRVTTFYLGVLDLFADMGLSQSIIDRENPTMHYILSHFLITSKSMGIKAVSFVYQDFKNLDEFLEWLELERRMGYDAKGCISPSQVALVHKIFRSKSREIQRAEDIIKLFEEQRETGVTGFVDAQYGFIDEPIYKGALSLLNRTHK